MESLGERRATFDAAIPFLRTFASKKAKSRELFQSLTECWLPDDQGDSLQEQLKLLELIQFLHETKEEEMEDRPTKEASAKIKINQRPIIQPISS